MKTDYAAQCRFFTAEDACRIALQAYYAADKHLVPDAGEPWIDEAGNPWAGPTDFAEAFVGELQARVGLLALDRLGAFHWCSMQWELHKLAADVEPEKMAPIIAQREAEIAALRAEFFAPEGNDLPSVENASNNAPTEAA